MPERVFFLWTGLKGAVPILLGMAIVESGTPGAARAYQVIFVIVGFSVTVQGGLVPTWPTASAFPCAASSQSPGPWASASARSRRALHRYHVTGGSAADGSAVDDLPCRRKRLGQPGHPRRHAAPGRRRHDLRAGDDVLVLAEPDEAAALESCFTDPGLPSTPRPAPRYAPVVANPGLRAHRVPFGSRITGLKHERLRVGGLPPTPHDHRIPVRSRNP